MAQSIDLSANSMVGLTRETLVSLCAALLRENGPQAAMHRRRCHRRPSPAGICSRRERCWQHRSLAQI